MPPDVWEDLEGTYYAGAGLADNREALFGTIALFRRAASNVAAGRGYAYPRDLDRRVTAYVRAVKGLDPGGR